MKGYTYSFPEPEKDRSYRTVMDAVSTDCCVRSGLTVTHIRKTIKTVILGGRKERVIRHITRGGSELKVVRVRNTFHHDTYITTEVSNSADTDISGSGVTEGEENKQKAQTEQRESKSRRPTSLDSEVGEQ